MRKENFVLKFQRLSKDFPRPTSVSRLTRATYIFFPRPTEKNINDINAKKYYSECYKTVKVIPTQKLFYII